MALYGYSARRSGGCSVWVLLLGVGHVHDTSLHLAEYRATLGGA